MYKVLQNALVEKDVEDTYRTALTDAFHIVSITSPYGTDGVLKSNNYMGDDINLIMLLEFKYNIDFNKRTEIAKVLIQALYYLKKFEDYGEDLPNIILVGDINECFCLHSNDIKPYLSGEYDWSIAPSEAPSKNAKLLKAIYDDDKVNPYIFPIDDHFNFTKVIEKAVELSKDIVSFTRITEKNINRVFDEFISKVLYHKTIDKSSANKMVSIFLSLLINKEENYVHPQKKQTLVTKNFGAIRIDDKQFDSFFKHYQKEYSPKEKDRLTSICDRLIEDTTRRFQGEFFTPTEWVIEAHKMIEIEFGVDWKEKYVVWDPAWGTGNLTRDFKFKELYCSTLNESDIGIANQRGYNNEAVKFQYDFLNDEYDKLPAGLKNAIETGREIIVFMNPPYGTANNAGLREGDHKAGIAKNNTNTTMLESNLGDSAQQLYTQFLFKIAKFNTSGISICLFSPPLFFTGGSFSKFREYFLDKFKFKNGYLINASNFADVKPWGLLFTVWCSGKFYNNEINLSVMEVGENGKPMRVSTKTVYNCDNHIPASKWIREETKSLKTHDAPQMSNSITIKQDGRGRLTNKALGYFSNNSNSVYDNPTYVFLTTSCGSRAHGLSIIPENFNKVTALFTARKTITSNWINQKDEYIAPNTEHPDYEQWNNDCLVYSLFNNSSNQSSLRSVEYKGRTWDIENQWFWMPSEKIQNLANDNNFDALYQDARNFGAEERFVYKELQDTKLSDDAFLTLLLASELLEDSMEYRQIMHEQHPEYHLNTWDAGWYQIKLILKEFMPNRLKEFRKMYKDFENRMREGVYKFGFLK